MSFSIIFNKRELKIFTTFFIIYFLFIHLIGWNENTNLILTKSIVDDGKFEIDNYFNITGDRSIINSHYYSDKVPGLSFIIVPIYSSEKFIYSNLFSLNMEDLNCKTNGCVSSEICNNVQIINYVQLPYFDRVLMVIATAFTSSLFGAFTVLLIYKITIFFTRNEKHKLSLAIIYGFATVAFSYSTLLLTHITGTFFVCLATYLILMIKQRKNRDYKYIFLTGFVAGFAIFFEYANVFIAFGILVFILSYKNSKIIIIFLVSGFLGISSLLIYNFSITGNPLVFPVEYLDPAIWFNLSGGWGMSNIPNPTKIIRLLVDPYRGLFFYCPILILSVIGLLCMYKKEKSIFFFLFISILLAIVTFSMYEAWWGFGMFGPRRLLPIVPLLVIPIACALKKINYGSVIILIFVSMLIALSSFQEYPQDILVKDQCYGIQSNEYKEKVNSFELFDNVVYNHFVPLLIEDGPRSRLLESFLVKNRAFDIRDYWPSKSSMEDPRILDVKLFTTPFGFVFMKVSFITTLVVFALILLIWKKDAFTFIFNYKYLFIILFLISLLYFFSMKNIMYEKNWFNQEFDKGISYHWMSNNATIRLYNFEKENVVLKFFAWNFHGNKTMEVFLNDRLIKTTEWKANESKELITPSLELKAGENVIRFHSVEGCDIPAEVGTWVNDYRCLSFSFFSLEKLQVKDLYGKVTLVDWYPEEKDKSGNFRWIGNESSVVYYVMNKTTANLTFDVGSYSKNRTLEVYVNDKLMKIMNINSSRRNVTMELKLNRDENVIRFHSVEGCDIPKQVENNTDERCLSFAFRNILIDN